MKKYTLTNSQIKKIARLAVQENGEGAVGDEVSLMANLFELQTKRKDIYDFIRNGDWFSRAAYYMDNGSASSAAIEKTKDVLVNGNRTLPAYINEHDCFSDITSAKNNGKAITKTDRSQYKKGVTVIKNRYGSTYTFYCFPTPYSDPFGYTAEAYKKVGGSTEQSSEKKTDTVDGAQAVIDIALGEVGYLEKRSDNNLDSKTGNAGSANYTKYARDIMPDVQGMPWCATFVAWCFTKAFGKSAANKMVNGLDADCDEVAKNYKKAGRFYKTPKKGDQILFIQDGWDYYHTGIVYDVTSSTVYTIEGNTSAGSQVIPNGGAVCKKSYALGNPKIGGYGRPAYGSETIKSSTGPAEQNDSAPETPAGIKEAVSWKGKVTASSLRVRKWAGTENEECSFSPLKKGTKVGVCSAIRADDGSVWYYILLNGKHGFVHSDYVSP